MKGAGDGALVRCGCSTEQAAMRRDARPARRWRCNPALSSSSPEIAKDLMRPSMADIGTAAIAATGVFEYLRDRRGKRDHVQVPAMVLSEPRNR